MAIVGMVGVDTPLIAFVAVLLGSLASRIPTLRRLAPHFTITLVLLQAGTAWSASPINEPPLDLGQTSFLDGEAGPGALMEIIGNGAESLYVTDSKGRAVGGTNKQWSANVTLHPVYLAQLPALGGKLGLEFLFPVSLVHVDLPGAPVTNQGGAGDITISPFIEWSDRQMMGRPFSSRFGLQGVVPSGSYAPQRLINIGSDAWQISPYYALTSRVSDNWEVSSRFIYDWSSKTAHPAAALNNASVQAGSQLAINLAASYAISSQFRVGLSGYALRQISQTRLASKAVRGSEEQVFGIGPGVLWSDGHATVIANLYKQFATENASEGVNMVARFLLPF